MLGVPLLVKYSSVRKPPYWKTESQSLRAPVRWIVRMFGTRGQANTNPEIPEFGATEDLMISWGKSSEATEAL